MENLQVSGRLQATLDDMKRRLEEEREAAEVLTRRLSVHRDQKGSTTTSSFAPLEAELAEAHKQLHQQKAITEGWIKQVNSERDAGRARLREAEAQIRKLQDQLNAAQGQLSEQREAAEGLIQQLVAQPNGVPASPSEACTDTVARELELARKELQDYQRSAEEQIQRLSQERDGSRALLAQADACAQSLMVELKAVRQQAVEQALSAEQEIHHLTAERDKSRAEYAEVESRTSALEQEFIAAHDQFREQRETALRVIRQLEAERQEHQMRLTELDELTLRLEDELRSARADLSLEASKVAITKEVRSGILDSVVDIQIKGQKLLDLLQSWSAKDADLSLEAEAPEVVSFFQRSN